jgi:hypothetical protein
MFIIREEQIDEAVLMTLADIELSDEELRIARATLAERHRELEQRRTETENTLRLQYDHPGTEFQS